MGFDYNKELQRIDEVIAKGPYKDTWESLGKYEVPKWYKDIKFGIFIHWGVYAAAAYANEWYPRNMYIKDTDEYKHHIEVFGNHKEHGYKDYIPMLTGENFDADKWTDLFEKSGAEYFVPVAEHHDGFQMYKSKLSKWNAAEMGPKRDVIGELREAADKKGLTFGTSSHRIEHWWFLANGRDFESDICGEFDREDMYWPSVKEPADQHDSFSEPYPTKEFMEDWLIRTCEIVDRFHPSILYFDWWIHHIAVRPYLKKAAAYYYNEMERVGKTGVINYKHDEFLFGSAVPDMERGQFSEAKPYPWQTDTSTCFNSWGYTVMNRYKEATDILCDLVDVVSKNGRMLLNIGPKPDGTVTDEETSILLEIGKWLKVNGEAIYGSRLYKTFGEGPTKVVEGMFNDSDVKVFTSDDFRFTVNHGNIYAIAMRASDNGEYNITSFAQQNADGSHKFMGNILKVQALGEDSEAEFKLDNTGLHIRSDYKPSQISDKLGNAPLVFRLTIE